MSNKEIESKEGVIRSLNNLVVYKFMDDSRLGLFDVKFSQPIYKPRTL